jgi:DegV family protein with EDD domain
MEHTIGVVTDSSCDLPRELLEESEVEVVPLTVHFGTEVYQDGELSMDEFWQKASGPNHPKTSQPAVGVFEDVFGRLVARGKQVICLTVTSKHSGTFNAAYVAAQRFGEAVKVFDSLSLSIGHGIQTLAAAQASRGGRSMQEIQDVLESLRERTRVFIVLDTLDNLRRGGRADAFISIADRMARVLDIKVIVNMVEGQLRLLGAARSCRSAMRRLVEQVGELGPLEHLAVLHTRNKEAAERLAGQLAERFHFPPQQIWLQEVGAVLACHAGPRAIAILAIPASSTG